MKFIFIIVSSIILISPVPELSAAGDSCNVADSSYGWFDTVGEDIKSFGEDAEFVWNSLGETGNKELMIGIGVSGAAFVTYLLDSEFSKMLERNKTSWADDLTSYGNDYGLKANTMIISQAVYIGGLASGWDDLRETGRLLYESIILTGMVTQTLKFIVGRARPYEERGDHYFTPFVSNGDYHSFPSGHTTLAFAMSTVISHQIDSWWAYAGFYGLSTLTGISRVYTNKHWLSDIVVGAAIGTAGAYLIIKANEKNSILPKSIVVAPTLSGINLSAQF